MKARRVAIRAREVGVEGAAGYVDLDAIAIRLLAAGGVGIRLGLGGGDVSYLPSQVDLATIWLRCPRAAAAGGFGARHRGV